MSKIIKNQTNTLLTIGDTGVSIPALGQYTIQTTDYLLWAASSDIISEIGNGNVIVNDGSFDLNPSEAADLIKGIYPKNISIVNSVGQELGTQSNPIYSQSNSFFNPNQIYTDISFTKINLNRDYQQYNTIYSYNGVSYIYCIKVTFNSDNIYYNVTIDGNTIIDINLADFEKYFGNNADDFRFDRSWLVWDSKNNTVIYRPKKPIKITSNITIQAKSNSNNPSRDVQAYLIDIIKE